jgi:hypothetical protein
VTRVEFVALKKREIAGHDEKVRPFYLCVFRPVSLGCCRVFVLNRFKLLDVDDVAYIQPFFWPTRSAHFSFFLILFPFFFALCCRRYTDGGYICFLFPYRKGGERSG